MLSFTDIENRFTAIDYNPAAMLDLFPIELDEERELHLFPGNAGYKAEIWDYSANSFMAETIATAQVYGTGDFVDDVCYCIERCFEGLNA